MKILIVEDDKDKRKQVEDVLKEANVKYQIEKAINPALRYICENHISKEKQVLICRTLKIMFFRLLSQLKRESFNTLFFLI